MWTSDISSMVFTRIKSEGTNKLKTRYPDINFTASDRASTNPKFPTVLVQELGSSERGQDLDGTDVNAVLCTFQIDVFHNKKQTYTKDVMDEIVNIMKKMRFSVVAMPEFQNTDSTYRCVMRCRRMIGVNDIL